MKALDETEIINLMVDVLGQPRPPFSRIGDDVAHLPVNGRRIVVKCDMLIEGTDVPKGMTLRHAARKAVVMSVSDLACKGIQPIGAIVSLGLPRTIDASGVRQLAEGFRDAKEEYGFEILGGDTNESGELVIDCCVLGFGDHIVPRSSAKKGDKVLVTGVFGYSAAGLRILIEGLKAEARFRRKAVLSVLKPRARLKVGVELARAGLLTSSIDSSDGLALSLYHIAESSNVDIIVDKIPTDSYVTDFAETNQLDKMSLVFHGGEEFELVATVPADRLDSVRSVEEKCGCPLSIIGDVVEGSGKVSLKTGRRQVLLKRKGWVHLSHGRYS